MTLPKEQGGLGFRDFESFNDASLGKLSWRLLQNPSCLLSRILKGKYFAETTFLEATTKSVESHGWQGLIIGIDLILKNSGWAIGDGESTKIWSEPWLSFTEQRRPMGPPPEAQLDMTVAQLLQPNRQDWNIEAIRQVLSQEEETILSLKPSRTGSRDKLIWLGTSTGEYTTRSGYETALKLSTATLEDPHLSDINWKAYIWKLHTTPKIKLFLWKIFRGALPVGSNLASRNIAAGDLCTQCNVAESTNHLFLHCNFAQRVWSLAPFAQSIDIRGMVDLASGWHDLFALDCLPLQVLLQGSWLLGYFGRYGSLETTSSSATRKYPQRKLYERTSRRLENSSRNRASRDRR